MYVGIANNSEYYISFINNLGSIAKFFLNQQEDSFMSIANNNNLYLLTNFNLNNYFCFFEKQHFDG